MQRVRDMPINRKLTLVILLACAAVLLLAGGAMIVTEWVTARRTMAEDMTVLADLLARNSAAPLAFHREEDAEELNEYLASLAADPRIVAAAVYDEGFGADGATGRAGGATTTGQVFGRYVRTGASHDFPARPPNEERRFVDGQLEVARPVLLDRKHIGTLYLRADLGRMYAQSARHAGIVAGILLVTIVIASALSPRLRKPIAEPILALAAVARRVAERKDYSARATRHSGDEVGLLTDAFNQMLSEIGTAQASLQRANESMQSEITERKAVEQQLRKAHDELAVAKEAAEAASRAKDQFLAVLSHELRTPLTPVLLTVSLLESDKRLADDVREDLRVIRRHVELEARLIDDLLDLTRIVRGKLKLTFEPTDAHVLVRDALRICCAERLADVTVSLAAKRHHVRADSGRFLQIFWNLLNNASKFTPPGKSITVRSTDAPGERVRFEVSDEGVGIEPSVLGRIFNAFEQADPSVSRRFGGLGLGLAIAKALVDAHGGTITARSGGEGRGATFVVEMPTVDAPQPRAPRTLPGAPTNEAVPASVRPIRQTTGRSLRVLLVEDHHDTLRLLEKLLSRLGHDVLSAASVSGALAIAGRENVDLVVSDLGLPDGSGIQLMSELRRQRGLSGICVSGFGAPDDIARCLDAGFVRHLTKPVDADELAQAIESAVRNGSPRRPSAAPLRSQDD